MRKRKAKFSRGLTLVELMIGVAIALFLTAAALTFVQHETRLMGVSQDRLGMIQGGRAALDLMADDIRSAGQGIGYDEAGNFGGLLLGQFSAGGQNWNPSGAPNPNPSASPPGLGAYRTISLVNTAGGAPVGAAWNSQVVDIGVVYATGAYRSIADFQNTTLEFCARDDDNDGVGDVGFQDGEVAIMREAPGIAAETIVLSGLSGPAPCSKGSCIYDCISATWSLAPTQLFNSGPAAAGVTYFDGEVQGGARTVVWFNAADANGWGTLRRAEFRVPGDDCAAIDDTCGGAVAEGAESLQIQVWQWNTTPPQWVNVGQGPIDSPGRLRVDVELVVRAEGTDTRAHQVETLRLRSGQCVPMPCGPPVDYTERRTYRTSIEIKNSGYMNLR